MRACARLQRLGDGTINLNGSNVASGSHRALARKLAMLGQEATAPEDLLVEDVVVVGRTPHQTWLKRWTSRDEELVDWAINICGLENLRYREVGALSGGQRQRVWIAMALVQDTPVLLLAEPTTYLDIAAQTDLLDLIKRLNSEQGKTIVMVLHDINLAARYADQIVAMRDGNVIAQGPPKSVVTRPLLKEIFNVDADVLVHPEHGTPIMIPLRSVNTSESASVLLA